VSSHDIDDPRKNWHFAHDHDDDNRTGFDRPTFDHRLSTRLRAHLKTAWIWR
jgi:hypothetical protein